MKYHKVDSVQMSISLDTQEKTFYCVHNLLVRKISFKTMYDMTE